MLSSDLASCFNLNNLKSFAVISLIGTSGLLSISSLNKNVLLTFRVYVEGDKTYSM